MPTGSMKTARALGFEKGDLVWTGSFPGVIVSDAHTATPCCEVWGVEHELGSAYATDLKLLEPADWVKLAKQYRLDENPPHSQEAKRALKKLKVEGYLK